jgi:hypothetical protein
MAELIMMIMDRKAGYLLARIDIRASFVLATAVCTANELLLPTTGPRLIRIEGTARYVILCALLAVCPTHEVQCGGRSHHYRMTFFTSLS